MSQDHFQDMPDRLDAQGRGVQPDAQPPSAPRHDNKLSGKWAMLGGVCSAVVLLLFVNLQAISDLAPERVTQNDTPGAFAMPVALLSVAWIALIPSWFLVSVIVNALRRKTRMAPPSFVIGAFVVLALGLGLFKFFGAGGAG
ncbi:hypothetical protein SAMN05444851_1879 [Aliiroseovarius sediminilitoris]|uniref:Uncharacterized protein n=1 Tax=Aliiroseovarius sediminilitoris TaxID=1173584 RepID=A0A1I0PTH7_9RHOB|nr:hypothetical protein [Aliiroseovarius sediminilitoris]SEW17604.1 hypothetical protein SAMN05444851_1879 [Aliiroseovarius sediminilitoris]